MKAYLRYLFSICAHQPCNLLDLKKTESQTFFAGSKTNTSYLREKLELRGDMYIVIWCLSQNMSIKEEIITLTIQKNLRNTTGKVFYTRNILICLSMPYPYLLTASVFTWLAFSYFIYPSFFIRSCWC